VPKSSVVGSVKAITASVQPSSGGAVAIGSKASFPGALPLNVRSTTSTYPPVDTGWTNDEHDETR